MGVGALSKPLALGKYGEERGVISIATFSVTIEEG